MIPRPRRTALLFVFSLTVGTSAAAVAQEPFAPVAPPAGRPEPLRANSPPLTLVDCFKLALQRSEEIAIHRELIAETEGRFLQALSGVLPRASFSSSDKQQDASGESAFKLKEIPDRKFVFSQPLFSGFKEFAAMAGSRAERRERLAQKTRAEHLVFMDVVDAFYLLVEQREDLGVLEAIRLALIERLDELRERERLGRSRRSELASAEAQLRRVEADLESGRQDEILARHLLEFLTGLEPIGATDDSNPEPSPVATEEEYLAKAAHRPDVRAAEESWLVAQQQMRIAQAKYWPTVGVEGNYYTKRVGASEGVDWDVLLKVDVPLFQGGQAVGAVKEAASRARQAKLQLEKIQRTVTLEIRGLYVKLQAARARATALQKALEAAEESYRLQIEDYRMNLVNNLEVLQALQALQDARRDVIEARYQAARLYWHLQAASGETVSWQQADHPIGRGDHPQWVGVV